MAYAITAEQLERVRGLAERCFTDFSYPGEFDWESFCRVWIPALNSGSGTIWLEPETGLIGYMIGPDQFNGWKTCLVNFWYVVPEKRGSGVGKILLSTMVSHAEDERCRRILMGHPVGHEEFFKSQGFEPVEIGFQKVI